MTTRVVVFFAFLSLAAPAGAVDTVMPSAGRASPVLPIAPGFAGGLQLQKGVSAPSFNLGGLQLKGLEVPTMGFQRQAQAIPALPQSAVAAGQNASAQVVGAQAAPLSVIELSQPAALAPDLSRQTQPGREALVPAFQRVSRVVEEKSQAMAAPLDALSRRGAAASSSEGFRRAGAEVFDILARASADDGSAPARPVDAGDSRSGGRASGLALSAEGREFSSSETGSARSVFDASGGIADFRAEMGDHGTAMTAAGRSGSDSLNGLSQAGASSAKTARWTHGVALVTMQVAGQALTLSDSGLVSEASRRAALAAERSFALSDEKTAGQGESWTLALSNPRDARWTAAEALGSASYSVIRTVPSASSRSAVSLTTPAAGAVRRGRVPLAPATAAVPSFLGLLPLLLLGLESRRRD